jgi:regulatory protein
VNPLRQRAIRLLARRDYSRRELAGRLAAHGTEEEIATLLAQLESDGLLSDARAAAAYVRSHGVRLGVARLQHDLRHRGLDIELARTEIEQLPGDAERARLVWTKKFTVAPQDAREWARQARFLRGRGFSTEVIRRLLQQPMDVEE